MLGNLRIELHSFDLPMVDLTESVKGVTWVDAVEQPWESIELTIAVPRFKWGTPTKEGGSPIPHVGDWLVVRDTTTERALAWGRVHDVSMSILGAMPSGAKRTTPIKVKAESFLMFMQKCAIYVSGGVVASDAGTLFTLRQWGHVLKDLGLTATNRPGEALPSLWKRIAQVELPATLSGLRMGYGVRVVHDPTSSAQYGPRFPAEPVPGPTLQGLSYVRPGAGTSVTSLLLGTFMPDAGMAEFFATLAEPGVLPERSKLATEAALSGSFGDDLDPEALHGQVLDSSDYALLSGADQLGFKDDELGLSSDAAAPVTPTTPGVVRTATALGDALGSNPLIVYRVRPWRSRPLSQFAAEDAPPVAGMFGEGTTWDSTRAQRIPVGDVFRLDLRLSDTDRVNACTVGLPTQPDTELRFWEREGLPVGSKQEMRRHGVRMYEPSWPFFPPAEGDPGDPEVDELMGYMRTVALQAAQIMLLGERFFRGTAMIRHNRTLVKGMEIAFDLDLQTPGDGALVGYVDALQHVVEALEGGGIRKRTVVTFSRGLLTEGINGLLRSPLEIRSDYDPRKLVQKTGATKTSSEA